jgi:excisionase family DNA binding protein
MSGTKANGDRPRFYSVSQVARIFGMSKVTVYRAIADGDFPAVKVRNRLIIPAQAIEAMAEAAVQSQGVVDAAAWTVEGA